MSDSKPKDQDILNALKYVQHTSQKTEQAQQKLSQDLTDTISESDEIIAKYSKFVDDENQPLVHLPQAEYCEESIEAISRKASQEGFIFTSYSDILTNKELETVVRDYDSFVNDWEANRKLDKYDWLATGVISSLSICLNLIFVGEGTASAGKQLFTWLGAPSAHVPNSPKVSFDKTLPRIFGAAGNHRWNSLSHHPTPAGFIHAVRDVLNKTSTHVVNGEVIIMDNINKGILKTWTNESFGTGIVCDILTASSIVLKHWWSDVNTSLGLPGPLMMLAKFLEFGSIEFNGQTLTIAQLVQQLFHSRNGPSGMDFRRFIGDSIIVLVCEVLTRLWFFCRALYEKKPIKEAFKMLFMNPKLRKALLTVHGSSCLFNAGTVYVTQNPLLINTAQWMALGRYLLGFLSEGLGKDAKRDADHYKIWIEKMRTHTLETKKLQMELRRFPRLLIG